MLADQRTRAVLHREWLIPAPAHHTDVAVALQDAIARREQEPGHASEVTVTADGDGDLVVGYTVDVDRDVLDHRSRVLAATVQRVRALAVEWSAAGGQSAATWRDASRLLHEALDGPSDGEPAR